MKYDKHLLATTLLLTPALFAFAPRGTKVAFSVADGATSSKSFHNTVEMSMDEMSMQINGQESPMVPDMEMTVTTNLSIEVSDEYVSMGAGKPKKLVRTFDELEQSTDMAMEMDIMGQVQKNDMSMPSSSELAGKTVIFTWDDDAGEYKTSYPEEGGDEKLLENLSEDMDLRAFLPAGEVAEDDEWSIGAKELISVLAPGGDLKLVPEDVDGADKMAMGNTDMGNFHDWFSEDMEGKVTATFKGTRETEDGVTVGVIAIAYEISNAVDMTEKVADAVPEAPEGVDDMQFNSIELALELEGEATLLWDLAAGHAHSFELSGDFGMVMDMSMSISAQGMDMDIDQSMEFSGSMNTTASYE
ncbi:MAG: hypothetical protein H6828_09045 [Planctomycetes bacterium]|nr:hypothetical protein [Planctomycetota bacterium]